MCSYMQTDYASTSMSDVFSMSYITNKAANNLKVLCNVVANGCGSVESIYVGVAELWINGMGACFGVNMLILSIHPLPVQSCACTLPPCNIALL